MSAPVGDGDSHGREGREKKFSAGKGFMKRIAYRIRGGIATRETNPPPLGPMNDLVLDVGEVKATLDEPGVMPTPVPVQDIASDVSQFPSQSDPKVNPISVTYPRGVDRHERTRRLLAKYGLSLEAQDWSPADSNSPNTVLRVEKQIRMRVRYTCHLCEHLFGAERYCKTCNHKRCGECPRHPSSRNKRREEIDKENLAVINTDVVTLRKREHEDVELVTRSRSKGKSQIATDGPILVPAVQLLQYSCHKCNIAFEQRGRLCSACGHIRCSRCPRKLADYNGNGEDQLRPERVHRPPRQRIRWICDHCESTFTEGSKVCSECLHKRCQACRRIPPKRVKLDHEENNETTRDRARVPGIS